MWIWKFTATQMSMLVIFLPALAKVEIIHTYRVKYGIEHVRYSFLCNFNFKRILHEPISWNFAAVHY